jgi:molybdopterin synthase sulfur carrier subunit
MDAPDSLRILYFAWMRDRVGTAAETVAPPPEVRDVAALRVWLAGRSARHGAAFARGDLIRCAVNQEIAGPEQRIGPGDEIAFFPPVTGG